MYPFAKRSCLLLLGASLLLPAPAALAADLNKVTAAPAVAAASQAKLSKEQALRLAVSRITLSAGMELNNASFRSPDAWRPFPEWSFYWVQKGKTADSVELAINASIHADTGELTGYSRHEPNLAHTPFANRISRDKAQATADSFLSRNLPNLAGQTRLYNGEMPKPKPPLGSAELHSFRYVRVVNGYLYPENFADVTINEKGEVVNYYLNWNDRVTFAKPGQIQAEDRAKERFLQHADSSLGYVAPWEKQSQEKPDLFLAYRNPFNFFVDAATGNPLHFSLKPRPAQAEPIPVSTSPLPPLYTGPQLTQAGAMQLAQKLFDLSLYKLRSASYNDKDYRGNRPVWQLEFEAKDPSVRPGYAYLVLDAGNGDVYNFSREQVRPLAASTTKPKWERVDLKLKAIESLRRWTPTMADEFRLVEPEMNDPVHAQNPVHSYSFRRYVNGVQAASGHAYVSFDAMTGELLGYSIDFGRETYPAQLPKHKNLREAAAAWLDESSVELVYMAPPLDPLLEKAAASGSQIEIPQREAKLVYRVTTPPHEQPYVLDAETGEWRSEASGNPMQIHRAAPSDIAGHPAEKALLLMYEYDAISLIDGKLMPERQITRGEMIHMLMLSLSQGRIYPEYGHSRQATFKDVSNSSRYFASVEAAVDRGLLDTNSDTLNPDEAITRQELATMIVRALGYRKLAEHTDMFQTNLTDIGEAKDARGAIILVTSLDIMEAENNRFAPQQKVSRADAALAFSRFLEKRSELQDRRIQF